MQHVVNVVYVDHLLWAKHGNLFSLFYVYNKGRANENERECTVSMKCICVIYRDNQCP